MKLRVLSIPFNIFFVSSSIIIITFALKLSVLLPRAKPTINLLCSPYAGTSPFTHNLLRYNPESNRLTDTAICAFTLHNCTKRALKSYLFRKYTYKNGINNLLSTLYQIRISVNQIFKVSTHPKNIAKRCKLINKNVRKSMGVVWVLFTFCFIEVWVLVWVLVWKCLFLTIN